MSLSFTIDEVLDALYGGILNRAPDSAGFEAYSSRLLADPSSLKQLVADMLSSPERFSEDRDQAQALRALYRAALGREPDVAGVASYGPWIQSDFAEGVIKVADSLYNSAEHQDRVLPVNPDRVIVDHSPHGELRAVLRALTPHPGDAMLIVEVGIDNPGAALSLDLVKLLHWRAVLIEPALDRHVAIESRFGGSNYRLLKADVLRRTPLSRLAPDDPAYARTKRAIDLGLLDVEAPLASLSEVLQTAGTPDEFGILVISRAPNGADVLNDLIEVGQFKPSLIVLMTAIPEDFNHLQQLGLSDAFASNYDTVSTTKGSVTLLRK